MPALISAHDSHTCIPAIKSSHISHAGGQIIACILCRRSNHRISLLLALYPISMILATKRTSAIGIQPANNTLGFFSTRKPADSKRSAFSAASCDIRDGRRTVPLGGEAGGKYGGGETRLDPSRSSALKLQPYCFCSKSRRPPRAAIFCFSRRHHDRIDAPPGSSFQLLRENMTKDHWNRDANSQTDREGSRTNDRWFEASTTEFLMHIQSLQGAVFQIEGRRREGGRRQKLCLVDLE